MSGGTNDTKILLGIIFFLALVTIVLIPLKDALRVQNYYVDASSTLTKNYYNVTDVNETKVTDTSWATFNIGSFLFSLLVWFNGFPIWFNLLFLILRIGIVWLLIRLFRSGGG
jgi:hypothetical protein